MLSPHLGRSAPGFSCFLQSNQILQLTDYLTPIFLKTFSVSTNNCRSKFLFTFPITSLCKISKIYQLQFWLNQEPEIPRFLGFYITIKNYAWNFYQGMEFVKTLDGVEFMLGNFKLYQIFSEPH